MKNGGLREPPKSGTTILWVFLIVVVAGLLVWLGMWASDVLTKIAIPANPG